MKQYGKKWYDMETTKSLKQQLTVETPLGNVNSEVHCLNHLFCELLFTNHLKCKI